EVVVERRRPQPNRGRHVRPLGVFVPVLTEELGRHGDDLGALVARRGPWFCSFVAPAARHLRCPLTSGCPPLPPSTSLADARNPTREHGVFYRLFIGVQKKPLGESSCHNPH